MEGKGIEVYATKTRSGGVRYYRKESGMRNKMPYWKKSNRIGFQAYKNSLRSLKGRQTRNKRALERAIIKAIEQAKKEEEALKQKQITRLVYGQTYYAVNSDSTPWPVLSTYLYCFTQEPDKHKSYVNESTLNSMEQTKIFDDMHPSQFKIWNRTVASKNILTDETFREADSFGRITDYYSGIEEQKVDLDEFDYSQKQKDAVYFVWVWFKGGSVAYGYPKEVKVY